jgi:PncC family amidohydrolase
MNAEFPFSKEKIDAIKDALLKMRQTVAVAESVTAGLLQNVFSQAEDARLFFQGGMTVYNIGQKCRQLHIEPIQAEKDNGVSSNLAIELATNITRSFCSHWGIGIVGYAAPVPEKNIQRPFAYFAIYEGGTIRKSGRLEGAGNNTWENQVLYVQGLLDVLERVLR